MTKHARFLKIEQRRAEEAPESEAADRGRIAAVLDGAPMSIGPDEVALELAAHAPAGDGTTLDPSEKGAHLDDAPATDDAPELALDTAPVEGQPFVRCARCGADDTIHAKACASCGLALDTAAQRAFNDKLWSAQQRRNERERATLADMANARAEERRSAIRSLPEPGTQLPSELLEPIDGNDGPFLLEAVRALQKPKWRWIAAAMIVGLPLFLVTLGGRVLSKLGWVLVLLFVLSMFPRSVPRRLLAALRERWERR